MGVLACGIAYNYVMENEPQKLGVPVLKVSQYPLPEQAIKEFAAQCESLLIAEDGQPMVEEQVKSLLGAEYVIKGRLTGDLPRMGELTPDSVGAALGIVGVASYVAAGVQDVVSGWLINDNMTYTLAGDKQYDFTAVGIFWLMASVISFVLPLANWHRKVEE
jgi:TPP-dependent indolepyruvate ferredoxin oxidoreductase alpha subunit